MKKKKLRLTFCLLLATVVSPHISLADMYDYLAPKDNEVFIVHSCIEIPLGNMLLIRKDSHFCALKFTRVWTEQEGKEKYATYEVYHQGDGSGDFSKNNVTKSEGKASALPLRGPFRPFIYQPGDSFIKCGPFKLVWEFKKRVCLGPPDKGRGNFGFGVGIGMGSGQVNILI